MYKTFFYRKNPRTDDVIHLIQTISANKSMIIRLIATIERS